MRVASFEQLDVYKEAFELQQRLFEASKSWPREEKFALTDQLRRASRAIGANVAEAWSKRRYEAHWVSKLTDADGELNETRHWLKSAQACDYLDPSDAGELRDLCDRIGKRLGRMIADAPSWVTSL